MKRQHLLLRMALLLTLVVVVLGAYVRLSDAGLGCPDWPVCYGRVLPPTLENEVQAANAAFPQRPVETAKAWKEQTHRYAASLLGLVIVVLALWQWRTRALRPGWLPAALVVLVIVQGLLGRWTVTLLLKPLIVVLHLLGGFTTLALLWWLYLRSVYAPRAGSARPANSRLQVWIIIAIATLVLQIALGGWVSSNYAALACPQFPLCQGKLLPPMDSMDISEAFVLWRGLGINYEFGVLDAPARIAIHIAHRLGAVITVVVVAAVAWQWWSRARAARGLACWLACGLVLQVALGIANVLLTLPLFTAVAHNAVAALLLLMLLTLLHYCRPQLSAR